MGRCRCPPPTWEKMSRDSESGFAVRRKSPGPHVSAGRLFLVCAAAALPLLCGCGRATFGRMMRPLKCMAAEHHTASGDRYLSRGDHGAAIESFSKAVQADPTAAEAHNKLAVLLDLSGRSDEALRHHRDAVKHAPENTVYALALARALRSAASTSMARERILLAAVRAYKHACWLDPGQFEAAFELGLCYRDLGQFDEAVQVFRSAGTIDRHSAAVFDQVGEIYALRGLENEALAEFRAALERRPDDPIAHRGIGRIHLARHRRGTGDALCLARAAAHLRKSLRMLPDQPDVEADLNAIQAEAPRALIAIDADAEATP